MREILRGDLKLVSLRRLPVTRLTERHKLARVDFAKKYISAVDKNKIDVASIFWSDEKNFASGGVAKNTHNDRVRVPKGVRKANIDPALIQAEHSGRWGNARIMVSMAISAIGATPPFFVPKGVKINGDYYLMHLENNLSPSMALIAAAKERRG